MRPILIALGGNALLKKGEKGGFYEQMKNVHDTIRSIIDLLVNNIVVITHGNGPQVGNIYLQQEKASKEIPPMPLDVCGAMSQGMIGYMLQQAIYEEISKRKISKSVIAIITRVLVDENDPAFLHPTKPIGPFYDKETAKFLIKEKGWNMIFQKGKGWRRVVPSPYPRKVLEIDVIKRLIGINNIVITAGGGGVPVIIENKKIRGVEGVIDKDLVSQIIASSLNCEKMIILTDVDFVYLYYKTKKQKRLTNTSLHEIIKYYKQGHFPPGSMGPKVLAAINFLKYGGKEVIITSIKNALDAIKGYTGTHIRRGDKD